MANRTPYEIVAQILEAANDSPIGVTWVTYLTGISYTQAKDYLRRMLRCELIEYSKLERKYRTAANGKLFLAQYVLMNELMND